VRRLDAAFASAARRSLLDFVAPEALQKLAQPSGLGKLEKKLRSAVGASLASCECFGGRSGTCPDPAGSSDINTAPTTTCHPDRSGRPFPPLTNVSAGRAARILYAFCTPVAFTGALRAGLRSEGPAVSSPDTLSSFLATRHSPLATHHFPITFSLETVRHPIQKPDSPDTVGEQRDGCNIGTACEVKKEIPIN
jgi:hypothetical protein